MPENKKQQPRKLPSLRDLINLVNFCEMEKDPIVRKLMAIVTVEYDPDLVMEILERIQPALNIKMLNPDPFSPNPKGFDVDGPVRIGKVKTTGAPFGLTLEELNQHTLITGRAGSGKTTILYLIALQLLQQGIPFLAFDFKQDYRHLLRYRGRDICVFNSRNFRFNPLKPPENCDPITWMQAFTNVFAQAYWLMAGSKGLIQQHLRKLYDDYGVFEGKNTYPALHDLLDSIGRHHLQRQFGREAGFMESARNRLEECILPLHDMLECSQGFPVEELLNKTVIFELEGLLSENQIFLSTILMRYIFQYRISNRHRGRLNHIILFDEGKMVYDRNRDNIQGLGPNEVTQFTSQIREFGEGLLVADQMPTVLSNSIKSNVYTTICLSQSGGENIREMARTMHLTKDQESSLTQLQSDSNQNTFEAIVKMNGRWLNPFRIEIIPFSVQKAITEEQLSIVMKPLLEKLSQQVVPRTPYDQILEGKRKRTETRHADEPKKPEDQTHKSPEVPDNYPKPIRQQEDERVEGNILIKILTSIREEPFIDQQERIRRLNLSTSSSTNNKYFKELEKEELVIPQKISLGSKKGVKVFYEITDKGKEYARMKDFHIPGKGDFKHKFWQNTIKKYLKSMGYNAEIEKRIGTKNVDVGFNINGKQAAVEIELSPGHLIENVTKDLEAGCDIIIIAVQNKTQVTTYRKKIQKALDGDVLKRIEIRTLTDFLK
jgi:predicted transcriptional regulator